MYNVEAMVTETSPTVLKLTADWPIDWLRGPATLDRFPVALGKFSRRGHRPINGSKNAT